MLKDSFSIFMQEGLIIKCEKCNSEIIKVAFNYDIDDNEGELNNEN